MLLLFLIIVFSAVYRTVLVVNDGFPPGADIGLHNSLIHSITQGGNTNFLYNFYHMGGGSSNTFPGYHVFVACVIFFTGLPDYLAQAFVAILFSVMLVPVAFLLTRKILNEPVALIVAFLVGVSYYDVFILLWSGYPNIVTLMLIPLTFYLLLEKSRFPRLPRLTVASLLSAAIFLTHSLSAFLFVAVIFALVFVALCLSRGLGVTRKDVIEWLVPIFVGGLMVSLFLIEAAPFYLNLNSTVYTGGLPDLQKALLPIRQVPFEFVLPFFACFFLSFLFLRILKVKLRQFQIVLLFSWLIIPAVLTQSYFVGFYTDYERFLYFATLPLVILVGAVIFLSARLLAGSTKWFFSNRTRLLFSNRYKQSMAILFSVILLLIVFFEIPHFSMTVSNGFRMQNELQVMTQAGYEAIQWIKNNTAVNSVFVADALYGWWLGGFAQRPTVSAVEPFYITNSREFEPALLASRLLDTNYLIDNGLIQVQEDGGYISRHNPQILAKVSNYYYPVPVLNFNDSEKTITYLNNGCSATVKVSDLPIREMHLLKASSSVSICVSWGNDILNYTEECTVYKGVRFVNLTHMLSSDCPNVSFHSLCLSAQTRDSLFLDSNTSLGLFDPCMPVGCQLIFPMGQPVANLTDNELSINCPLGNQSKTVVYYYVGAFETSRKAENPQIDTTYQNIFADNLKAYTVSISDSPIDSFDYHQAITYLNASYIVLCDNSQLSRFAKDPTFTMVFSNDEVTIFSC